MAGNTPRLSQPQTTFQIIEPLFYDRFNTKSPIFPDWTLERMPRNVNTKRIILDKYTMSKDGWLYESYNTKGIFRCVKCMKSGIKENYACWTSAYTTVLFRAYYGADTDEHGETWIGGWIQMKIFAQQCQNCGEFITGALDNERPRHLVEWLYRWVANKFYGYNFRRSGYQGKNRTRSDHESNLCEACEAGWCLYTKFERHNGIPSR